MKYIRERPICRRALVGLCKKYDCSLQELLDRSDIALSKNLRIQAHKMISEGEFRSAKQIRDFNEKIKFDKEMGVIKK